MDRDKFKFDYFFNAGIDYETGLCDAEGSDVWYNQGDHRVGRWKYIGSLYGFTPGDVSEMTDEELEEAIRVSFVPSKKEAGAIELAAHLFAFD